MFGKIQKKKAIWVQTALDRYERPMPVMTGYDQLLGKEVIS